MFSTPALLRRVTIDIDTPGMQDQLQVQQQQTFPFKLYNMLEYACDSEFSSCISWSDNGSSFIIRDKDVMMANLAPKFFNWTKFRSFVSDLHVYMHDVYINCFFCPSKLITNISIAHTLLCLCINIAL